MTTKPTSPINQTAEPKKNLVETIKDSFRNHVRYSLGKSYYDATERDFYQALSFAIRDQMVDRWMRTQQSYYEQDAKRIYYISMEFLIGRTLGNSLINLGIYDECHEALQELGYNLEALREVEWDAGLGNGGLGRLAACFLDSMATLALPAYGYGIRYEYGMFCQHIENGYQVEKADTWLRYGHPWEIARPEIMFPVRFGGRVQQYKDRFGKLQTRWIDTEEVMAMAHDTPIPGYKNETVNTMRLWSAKTSREFELSYFNHGDYIKAVEEKNDSENISRVLYPNDNVHQGRELRLKQEYFLVSATIQDIVRRYKKHHVSFDDFAEKTSIQLNDTHPAMSVAELMRIFIDHEGLDWDKAWNITRKTFCFTNHTTLPEALEKWKVAMLEKLLPRNLQIIYEINYRFLQEVAQKFPNDNDLVRRLSIVEEDYEKKIRMANLAIVGSHAVNGVSALHTELLKKEVFRDFYTLWPEKFFNKTNGITPRRWLRKSNQDLARLITSKIGDNWVCNLNELKRLSEFQDDANFRKDWREVKIRNKQKLAKYVKDQLGIVINPESMFDCQIKRIHEYKRQLLNVLHVIDLYNKILDNTPQVKVPRTVMFAGKAAPGYYIAKLIIKLINSVGDKINKDKRVSDYLKVVFLPNYSVSLAEKIIPAADLSEQISTAGTEASGTGNMKLSLNGALTIGTLDGANIEIKDAVGEDNIFIFGHTTDEIMKLKQDGYNPLHYYEKDPDLKRAIDLIQGGAFSGEEKGTELFKPIIDALLPNSDKYCHLADFRRYVECQQKVSRCFQNQDEWTRKSIINVANMGRFSSDETIKEYAREIWNMETMKR